MSLLLLSGLPGTGKSHYGKWLADEHGYVQWETEAHWDRWGALMADGPSIRTATSACNVVRALGADVVVEWGFVPADLPFVRVLGKVGLELWWFSGDEAAARQSWQTRPVPLDDIVFDNQLDRIHDAWSKIEPVYRDNIIETVMPGPTYLSEMDIYRRMFFAGD